VPRGHPGHIDALELFGPHVRSWITTSQENLCAACNSLEATTELGGVGTAAAAPLASTGQQGGVAPIAKQMLANLSAEMHRWVLGGLGAGYGEQQPHCHSSCAGWTPATGAA
jgi:hypothetical protein